MDFLAPDAFPLSPHQMALKIECCASGAYDLYIAALWNIFVIIMKESKKHHFVPQFLLRPWLIENARGQENLRGYWWDRRHGALMSKLRGLKSFCFQMDLLTLGAHKLGRDAIERIFFGEVDTKGAAARSILMNQGPKGLNWEQRCDFVRLLLSLEARRRQVVLRLRHEMSEYLAKEIDADPKIRAAMAEQGIRDVPSSYIQGKLGFSLEDRALTNIQALVENPRVGGRLINAHWAVKRIAKNEGSFVLSDRPLIRIHGYDQPGATWVLPLEPYVAFVACNDNRNMNSLAQLSGQRFVKRTNKDSVSQAERFVFCVDQSHEHWLEKRMKPRA